MAIISAPSSKAVPSSGAQHSSSPMMASTRATTAMVFFFNPAKEASSIPIIGPDGTTGPDGIAL